MGPEYRVNTFKANTENIYQFSLFGEPLQVPDLLPTVEKMLTSFHITKQQDNEQGAVPRAFDLVESPAVYLYNAYLQKMRLGE